MRNIKKNILDLEFQKNLIIASTTVVILFTYLIGLFIAFITGGIKFNDYFDFVIFFGFSTIIFGFCFFIFIGSSSKIKTLPEAIKNL